jgi:hypothetical protein
MAFPGKFLWSCLIGLALGWGTAAEARVIFEETSKDFGSVPYGKTLIHRFKMTNGYNQPLHVASIRTSCGVCTKAAVDKTDLQPGESGTVIVTVDTRNYVGFRTFTVFLTFDRPYLEESQLLLQAYSRSDIVMEPSQLDFGRHRMGNVPPKAIQVEHRGTADWQITGVVNDNGYILPKLESYTDASGRTGYRITVRLREDTPPGSWHAEIWLTTNDPGAPRLHVPLTVEITGMLAVTPSILQLGQVGTDSQVEKKVVVRGAQPFKITKVEGVDADTKVILPTTAEAKTVHVLKVQHKAGKEPTEINKKLRIITDLPKENTVEVTLRGQAGS